MCSNLTTWTIGELVVERVLIGTVETGSTTTTLILSNLVGEFLQGEEVVQGNKVSRIVKDGEVTGFMFTDKGTGNSTVDLSTETALKVMAIGSETELTVAAGDITVSSTSIEITDLGRSKLLNFPYPEGSALNSKINLVVETVPTCYGFRIILPNQVNNTLTKTKSIFSSLADTNDFSADISVQNNVDAEFWTW